MGFNSGFKGLTGDQHEDLCMFITICRSDLLRM